jgi:hypothetical protein
MTQTPPPPAPGPAAAQPELPLCPHCLGRHEPDSAEVFVDWQGRRYWPPFRCLCCGKEICARQFAFGRCCGPCDCGACNPGNRSYDPQYAHPRYEPA